MAQACLGLWALCQVANSAAGSSEDQPVVDPPVVPVVEVTAPATDWPIDGAFGARLYCIEGEESNHSAVARNARSGAAGWLQWLAPTARAWNVSIGNRRSEWLAAARIADRGETFFRSQWPITAARCP